MDLSEKAKEIIENIQYITIATTSLDNQPWNTPVAAWHDNEFNFYWASYTQNQHSKNINENPKVFIVIYDSTAPEGTGEGVYIIGKAHELNNQKEINKALSFNKNKLSDEEKEYSDDYPRRIYKLMPEKFWMNGDGNINGNYIDVRFEINLK